ncbi:MAG: LVIVD repeat-containing protein [Candidatus Hodarchaeales archaeon]|jgi:hypothetical protein
MFFNRKWLIGSLIAFLMFNIGIKTIGSPFTAHNEYIDQVDKVGTLNVNERILQIEKLSSVTIIGSLCGIKVIDEVAYVCDHTYGLKIYNVSNPVDPELIGQTLDSGIYHDIDVDEENNRVYLADLEDGLVIFEFSDMSNPTRIGSYDVGSQKAAEVQAVGTLVYLANFVDGLEIFNVSDPSNIIKIGSYSADGGSFKAQVVGNNAYMTAGRNKLVILDVTNPVQPIKLGSYYDGERVRYFYIEEENDEYIYVTTWNDGFKILNISDSTHPTLLGEYNDVEISIGVFKYGNLAFVGEWERGMAVFDVSDPTNPQLLQKYSEDGGVLSMFVDNDIVYVGTTGTILSILRINYDDPEVTTTTQETQTTSIDNSENNTGISTSTEEIQTNTQTDTQNEVSISIISLIFGLGIILFNRKYLRKH